MISSTERLRIQNKYDLEAPHHPASPNLLARRKARKKEILGILTADSGSQSMHNWK